MIVLEGRKQDVDALVFSPDGRELALGGTASHVQVWDLGRGEVRSVLRPQGPHRAVVYLADNHLLTATGGGAVRVAARPFARTAHAVGSRVNYLHATPTADGRWSWPARSSMGRPSSAGSCPTSASAGSAAGRAATLCFGCARVRTARWSVAIAPQSTCSILKPGKSSGTSPRTPRRCRRWPSARTAPSWPSPRGTRLLLCELATGRRREVGSQGRKHFTDVAFHPSGRVLAASSNHETVRVFDAASLGEPGRGGRLRLGGRPGPPDRLRARRTAGGGRGQDGPGRDLGRGPIELVATRPSPAIRRGASVPCRQSSSPISFPQCPTVTTRGISRPEPANRPPMRWRSSARPSFSPVPL